MKIKYRGKRPRDIAARGRDIHVEPGDVIEVDDQLGRSLLRQPAHFETAAEPKKAIEKKEAD